MSQRAVENGKSPPLHTEPSNQPSHSIQVEPGDGGSLTTEAVTEYARWIEGRGYGREFLSVDSSGTLVRLTRDDPYGFNSLSDAEVRTLARSGNANAQFHLAERLLSRTGQVRSKEQVEEAVKLLTAASAQGYTNSLNVLSDIELDLAQDKDPRTTLTLHRDHLIESYAYNLVSSRRGDLNADTARKVLESSFPLDFETSQLVSKRADEIYDSLSAERSSMGLGDFDDGVPESVIATNRSIRASYDPVIERIRIQAEMNSENARRKKAQK